MLYHTGPELSKTDLVTWQSCKSVHWIAKVVHHTIDGISLLVDCMQSLILYSNFRVRTGFRRINTHHTD